MKSQRLAWPMLILPFRLDGERIFRMIGVLALALPLLLLVTLVAATVSQGADRLGFDFIGAAPSRLPERAGIFPALAGSLMLLGLTALIAIPIAVGTAIHLEFYARPGRFTRLVELAIATLAGVPSIIYALLGLEVFVRVMMFGRSLIAGAATLALLGLPLIIIASREAMRTVPAGVLEAARGLGGDTFISLRVAILPVASPGILTGITLALARAIGETAPLITIGAVTWIAFAPDSLASPFTALPIQIFNWLSRPQAGFHTTAAAGITVLLSIMFIMSFIALRLRARATRLQRGH
jgi:phosphate transport system permease protein